MYNEITKSKEASQMEKYKYDKKNGLWYELQGDYYLPCLTLPYLPEQTIDQSEYGRRLTKDIFSTTTKSATQICSRAVSFTLTLRILRKEHKLCMRVLSTKRQSVKV